MTIYDSLIKNGLSHSGALKLLKVKKYQNNNSRWITIGGTPGKDGNHEGGTHVKVSGDGSIQIGPPAIEGKKISELGQNKQGQEQKQNVDTGIQNQPIEQNPQSPSQQPNGSAESQAFDSSNKPLPTPATIPEPTVKEPEPDFNTPEGEKYAGLLAKGFNKTAARKLLNKLFQNKQPKGGAFDLLKPIGKLLMHTLKDIPIVKQAMNSFGGTVGTIINVFGEMQPDEVERIKASVSPEERDELEQILNQNTKTRNWKGGVQQPKEKKIKEQKVLGEKAVPVGKPIGNMTEKVNNPMEKSSPSFNGLPKDIQQKFMTNGKLDESLLKDFLKVVPMKVEGKGIEALAEAVANGYKKNNMIPKKEAEAVKPVEPKVAKKSKVKKEKVEAKNTSFLDRLGASEEEDDLMNEQQRLYNEQNPEVEEKEEVMADEVFLKELENTNEEVEPKAKVKKPKVKKEKVEVKEPNKEDEIEDIADKLYQANFKGDWTEFDAIKKSMKKMKTKNEIEELYDSKIKEHEKKLNARVNKARKEALETGDSFKEILDRLTKEDEEKLADTDFLNYLNDL